MSQIVVVENSSISSVGAVSFWRLDGEIDRVKLAEEWAAAGLDPAWLPAPCSAKVALSRALARMKGDGRSVVTLKDGGHALTTLRDTASEAVASRVAASVDLVVKLATSASGEHVLAIDLPTDDETAERAAIEVRRLWSHYRAAVVATDVSVWLADIVSKLDAVGLREGGGVYFVPATTVAQWRKIADAVSRSSSHRISQLPAMRSDDAVAAVLAALEDEAAAHVAKMDEILTASEVGARFLRSRIRDTDAVASKLERYEALLGAKLDMIKDKIIETRASLSLAEIQALNLAEQAGAE